MRNKKIKISLSALNPPNADINVTPLVDVVLVLLIIFMVLSPLLEKNIAIQVPEDSLVNNISEGQLHVLLDKTGAMYLNQEAIADSDYVLKLRQALAAKNNPAERVVFVSADGQASYEKVVFALDGAKEAGAVRLGVLTSSSSASSASSAASP